MSRIKLFDERYDISTEDLNDGVARPEPEKVFYAKASIDLLRLADSLEEQEQWELRIMKGDDLRGRQRVRRTRPATISSLGAIAYKEDQEMFVQTNKSRCWGMKSIVPLECNTLVTPDCFNQYKWMSDRGMYKLRACFAIPEYPGLKWEIDFFYKDRENIGASKPEFHEWVKIDLEATPEHPFPLTPMPKMPVGLTGIIYAQRGEQTRQESKIIEDLYDNCFIWSK